MARHDNQPAAQVPFHASPDVAARRWEALVHALDGVVWEADADTFQCTFISRQVERLLGYPVERWLTEPTFWPDHLHPDDRERVRQIAGRARLDGSNQELEYRLRAADGRYVWVHDRMTLLEENGLPPSVCGFLIDITEYKRVEEELRESAQRLQTLSRRLLEVQEQERRHLARELHDEIGQLLTGLKFSVEACGRASADNLRVHQQEAQALVKELTTRVRDLSMRLRPTMLDDLGLLPALLWHFERYSAQTRIRVHFEHRGLDGRFPSGLETAVYRIVQEALTNVARHAGVHEVTVRLWCDPERLGLQIEDFGHGFDADWKLLAGTSSGLSGMQERAVLLGGCLAVESAPGRGTRVTAELPLVAG